MPEPTDVELDPQTTDQEEDNLGGQEPVETPVDPTNGQPTDVAQSFDPVSYIDSLELPDDHKKTLRDGWLRQEDYTRKTQEVSRQRKLFEQWQPVIERIAYNPKLYEQIMQGSQQQPQDDIPDDPREYANYVKNQTILEMRSEMAREADYKQAESLDPRLVSSSPEDQTFQRIVAGLVAQDTDYLSGRKTATEATRDALENYEQFYTGIRKKTETELTQKAQNKQYVTPTRSSRVDTTQPQPKNIWEAYKQALEEIEGGQ